jgi:integrase
MGLQEEVTSWKARSPKSRPSDPVFITGRPRDGKLSRQTERNAQARFKTATAEANKKLAKLGIDPIGKASPHSLRRTYASLRAALRDDPIYIAEQMGHRDARFYQRAAKRRERLSGRYLQQFDAALVWAQFGHKSDSGPAVPSPEQFVGDEESRIVER